MLPVSPAAAAGKWSVRMVRMSVWLVTELHRPSYAMRPSWSPGQALQREMARIAGYSNITTRNTPTMLTRHALPCKSLDLRSRIVWKSSLVLIKRNIVARLRIKEIAFLYFVPIVGF